MKKRAFTMVELVFVIVILGILAGVAIPRLIGTREDAYIVKAKTTIASIRQGIGSLKSANMLTGNFNLPDSLDEASTNTKGEFLFYREGNISGSILQEPIISIGSSDSNGWVKDNSTSYTLRVEGVNYETFEYNSNRGTFSCLNPSSENCRRLTQ